jgi:hypothetical protein
LGACGAVTIGAMPEPIYVRADIRAEGRGQGPSDRPLADLAAQQHGVVSAPQLHSLGLSPSAVSRRVSAGRLHPVFRGVYAVGHEAVSPEGRWLAAVIASGEGALLSHLSAAVLWGLRPDSPAVVDVSAQGARRRRLGIRIHRPTTLRESDRAEERGIPVTAVPRTLLDLASVLSSHKLERALIEAERLHLLDRDEALDRCRRGHRGSGRLRDLILREPGPATRARSELELRFLELCRRHELPPPEANVYVAGFLVDALWPDARLAVELDGDAFHRTVGDRRRDRERDRTLTPAGYTVIRFGWEDVTAGAPGTAATVHALLVPAPHLP